MLSEETQGRIPFVMKTRGRSPEGPRYTCSASRSYHYVIPNAKPVMEEGAKLAESRV
jgi:hypothetical protein